MRKAVVFSGALVIALLVVVAYENLLRRREAQAVKPYLTYTRLIGAAEDCDDFWKERHHWPESMAQLRTFRALLIEWGVDLWDRDFLLVPYNESLGYGEIISYGRDGKPGGSADADQDIIVRFPTSPNTEWNTRVGQDLKRPHLRIQ